MLFDPGKPGCAWRAPGRWAAGLLGLLLAGACSGKPDLTYQEHRTAAAEAYLQKDYQGFLDHTLAARNSSPHHPGLIYSSASAYALVGRSGDAIAQLRRLADMGLSYNLMGEGDLRSLTQLRPFQTILTDMAFNRIAIIASERFMELPAPEAHIEGIAYDPVTERYYFGAVRQRKILYRRPDGTLADFAGTGDDDLWAVLGVALDVERRVLWAVTSVLTQMENYAAGLEGQSALVAFHLDSGEKLGEYRPVTDDDRLFGFNDLAVAGDGSVFVSDSRGTIWLLPRGDDGMTLFFQAEQSFQGLALPENGGALYAAAYGSGIWKFDLAQRSGMLLPYPANASLLGLDGLVYHNGYLVAVQNGARPYRILKLELNAQQDSITAITVLERNHPAHGEPTLGQIIDGHFVYIANSPWGKYDSSGAWPADVTPEDIIVLRLPLD